MKQELEFDSAGKEYRELRKWFEKWGHRKWQYVMLHQLPIVAGWNVYWFLSDHNLSIDPLNWPEILQVIVRELPILLAGIVFWTIMKIRSWNAKAFRVGILNSKGKFPVEGSYHLEEIVYYTQRRIRFLSNWNHRWSGRSGLFLVANTSVFFLFIIIFLIGAKVWQKGNAWINSFYPSDWPVYILLIGLPFVFALYVSMEIWRENETDYLASFRFQNSQQR